MRKILFACLGILATLAIETAHATEYGDLYNVKWCPCNPDEQFNAEGSVVLGRTVMCPCSSMYDGYGHTFEKDVRKVQEKASHAYDVVASYKYYVGFEYNKSQLESSKKNISFPDVSYATVNGLNVPAGEMLGHHDNIGVVLGFRPHRNFGFEAFYNRTYNDNEKTRYVPIDSTRHMMRTYSSRYQAYGLDIIGYLPVTQYFDFVAFVGLGEYRFKNNATFEGFLNGNLVYSHDDSFNENKMAYRVGGGVQFNIAQGVVLRLLYKYINVGSDAIHYLQEYSASLRFLF